MLEKDSILSKVRPKQRKSLDELELHDTLPSTNDYLLERAKQNSTETNCQTIACFAESQTHGRGQHGRTWVSPHGKNIYLSILFTFYKDVTALKGLSLATAVAITKGLKQFNIEKGIGLKWPNDVYYQNRKLAGILIELRPQSRGVSNAVIGVGLNVNMPQQENMAIDQPWVDIQSILGKTIDRNLLAGILLDQLIETASIFEKSDFSKFIEDWQSLDLYFGKPLSIANATQTIDGIGQGVNMDGQYLLKTEHGIQAFSNGKITIKTTT